MKINSWHVEEEHLADAKIKELAAQGIDAMKVFETIEGISVITVQTDVIPVQTDVIPVQTDIIPMEIG